MKKSLIILFLLFLGLNQSFGQSSTPNILLITLDDMNWDSSGSYGNQIPELTPHMDRLANEGILFERAYVQASNCSPSRNVIQTSLYPHQSGMRGFYFVQPKYATLPEILKQNGFTTGVINKSADTSLSPEYSQFWDYSISIQGGEKRSAKGYSKLLTKFLNGVSKDDKPFYCVVNVADPHKPFFNDKTSREKGFDKFAPSKIFTLDEVEIPGFLPKHPKIKQEILNYYNSVKRGDDCIGEILSTLENSEFSGNTVVILLSDHGMPLPFAKSTVYQNGVRVPLMVKWPNKIPGQSRDNASMVSAVDIAPTILDIVKVDTPKHFEGTSFYNALSGQTNKSPEYVFAQFDENAGGIPRPTRTVINKKYGYVFNPWATGKYEFQSASASHTTYKVMKKMAENDSNVKDRFDHWVYRSVEELYDYETDPNATNNLINDPEYAEVVKELRELLKNQMVKTNDYVLEAFKIGPKNTNELNAWMEKQIEEADERTKTIKWKRYKNNNGLTKNNSKLFQTK